MILERQNRAGWGARVIDRLAHDLREAFPDMKGVLPRNLKYMRAFASAWPDRSIVQETPYLDRHNDHLQIYARRRNGGFVLTDDGYTLQDLEQSGCKLDSVRRQGLLKMTLNGFGVQLNDRALEMHTSPDNFGLRKHNLMQAPCSPSTTSSIRLADGGELLLRGRRGLARPGRDWVYPKGEVHRAERLRPPVRFRRSEVPGSTRAPSESHQPTQP